MKLSFSTLSCPDWSWGKVLDEAVRLGYDGVEVRGADGEMYLPRAKPFLSENIEATLADLSVRGIRISNLGSSVAFHDPSKTEEMLIEGKAYIDLAAKLGAGYVRVFGDKIIDRERTNETILFVIEGCKILCDYIGDRDVMILLETHGDFPDVELLRAVFEGVGNNKLGLLWDIEHVFKRYGSDAAEFYAWAQPYIKHVHVKDTKTQEDGTFRLCMIGEGDVPIASDCQLLDSSGYEGFLSLEWEKKWVPSLQEPEIVVPYYADYMRKICNGYDNKINLLPEEVK